MSRPTEAQWQAARALAEPQPATRSRIAAVLGVDASAVYERAAAENWRSPDFRRADVRALLGDIRATALEADGEGFEPDAGIDREADALFAAAQQYGAGRNAEAQGAEAGAAEPLDPFAVLARTTQFVSRQLTQLMEAAERRGGRLDKKQIDGLAALARMMERWETLARERAKEEELESDEELAETLRKINERIVELARDEADRLVAAGYRPEKGKKGA